MQPFEIIRQQTLKSAINCSGVGLHSGRQITMTLKPAPANHGIVFRRTDVTGQDNLIPARWDMVVDTRLCTLIANADGVKVGTIEHLMAALAGCGIDNALVEIDGPEVPVMDGSSEPFVFLIECAGVQPQDAARRALKILKKIRLTDGDKTARLAPSYEASFGYELDYDHPVVRQQSRSVRLDDGAFKQDLSRARTFGFLHEVDMMRRAGLARGGSLDNAVVIGPDRVMNPEGLRYRDEFVRHKILDAIGDLYIAGGPLLGHFHGQKSGHDLNNRLLRKLFATEGAYAWVELTRPAALPQQVAEQRIAAAIA